MIKAALFVWAILMVVFLFVMCPVAFWVIIILAAIIQFGCK